MKYFIFISLFFLSCTPQKRLARLIKNHPELSVIDTFYVKDTIVMKMKTTDTLINWKFDTAYINSNDGKVKVRLVHVRDSIKVNILQKQDTIFIKEAIPYKQIVNRFDLSKGIAWYWIVLILTFAVLTLFAIINKLLK